MIFGPSGQVHDPPNQLFLALETPNYFNEYKKNLTRCLVILFGGKLEI